MSIIGDMVRGAAAMRASVTLDNINMSQDFTLAGSGRSPGRVLLAGNKSATYERLYREQHWVSVAVNTLALAIGRLPLPVYVSAGREGERSVVREGALPELLEAPVLEPQMSPFEWKAAIVRNIAVHGNAVVVKVRPGIGRPPVELIPSSFAFWTVQGDPPEWYIYHRNDGGKQETIPFRPSEVIHFQWGLGTHGVTPSPMEALAATLGIEDAAQRMMRSSYENAARPSGVFIGPAGNENIMPEHEIQAMRNGLERLYGGVDNAFRFMILQGGVEWKPMSHNLVDSEIINTRKLTREEVAAAYRIPPPIIGILDHASFSNIDEQHVMFYQDTLGPWTTMIEEVLKAQMIASEPTMRGQYVEFNLNEVMKGAPERRFTAYKLAANWMTPNEIRARENLAAIDDPRADMIWVAPGAQSLGPSAEEA